MDKDAKRIYQYRMELKYRAKRKALYAGQKTFVGKPCPHGHEPIRWVSNHSCVECGRERGKRLRKEAQQQYNATYTKKKERILVSIAGRPRAKCCEICGSHGRTVFDHSHATGEFRGWLCSHCNRALGQAKDSPKLLIAMANYLMKSSQQSELKMEASNG